MKISSKGDYALRALLTLAIRDGEKQPIRLPEIADQNHIPIKFLEQIMIQLKGAGFVTSRRGRHGGYMLARRPAEFTMGDVIRLIDGTIAPVGCVSESDYISCTLESRCVLQRVFMDIRNRIGEIVDQMTFARLVQMGVEKRIPNDEKVKTPTEDRGEQVIPLVDATGRLRLTAMDASAEIG